MKLFVIFCIVLQIIAITVSVSKRSATSKITREDLRRYRILRYLSFAISSGTPFGLMSISKQLAKPAVSNDAVRRKNPWVDGVFRSSKKKWIMNYLLFCCKCLLQIVFIKWINLLYHFLSYSWSMCPVIKVEKPNMVLKFYWY